MDIKLKKPIIKDDNQITSLTLNLDALTGQDIINAEREARMRGDSTANPLFSSTGLAIVAAKSAGMISDDIITLSAPDFIRVTTSVSNFLYEWVLPTLTPGP